MRRFMTCVMMVVVSVMAFGCEGTRLPDAREFEDYSRLTSQFEALGSRVTRVPVTMANGKQFFIAVHESGPGDRDRVFVLIPGVVSDARTWRFVQAGLGESDVIAMDVLGSGESDAPSVKELGEEGYSPTALARSILEALRDRLGRRKTAAKVTLVGHSLGGAAVLRMYGHPELREKYKDVLQQVDSLVLLAPADVCITEPTAPIRSVLELTDIKVLLARSLGLTGELAAQAERKGMAFPESALREEADRIAEILTDEARRHATQEMILAAVPRKGDVIDWAEAERWQASYRDIRVRTLILWGSRDTTLPSPLGYRMQQQIPGARLRIMSPAMHSLAIEQPLLCVKLLREFVAEELEGGAVEEIAVHAPQRVGAGS